MYRPEEEPPLAPGQEQGAPQQGADDTMVFQAPVTDDGETTMKYQAPGQQFQAPAAPPGVPVSPFGTGGQGDGGQPGAQSPPPQQAFPSQPGQGQQPYYSQPGQQSQPQQPQQPMQGVPGQQQPFPGQPGQGQPQQPLYDAQGNPVSGVPGMAPVSSVPASAVPVSGYDPGQWNQQQQQQPGGQLAPVSSVPGSPGAWDTPQIERKGKKKTKGPKPPKKSGAKGGGSGGGKAPMIILLTIVVVIVAGLAVGGYFLFKPQNDDGGPDTRTTDQASADPTEEPPAEAKPEAVAADGTDLKFVVDSNAGWESSTPDVAPFTAPAGAAHPDLPVEAVVGAVDAKSIGMDEEAKLADVEAKFAELVADSVAGAAPEGYTSETYRVDGHAARFAEFTVGDQTFYTALITTGPGEVSGFAAWADADNAEAAQAMRQSLMFGALQ